MRRAGICLLSAALLLLAGCGAGGERDIRQEIGRTLGVDLSAGTVQESSDTHGGFHGDGQTFAVVTFADFDGETLSAAAEGTENLRPLPLPEGLQRAVYGSSGCVTDGEGNLLMPVVASGWYYYHDRHSDAGAEADADFMSHGSWNFTFALYDADIRTLYYYELDT